MWRYYTDQTTKSTIEGLKKAFTYFDCLPKLLVTRHAKGREAVLNPSFELFIIKCGVPVIANTPYSPNEKCHVEQSVNLVQTRVLTRMKGKFLRLEDANIMLMKYVEEYMLTV